MRPSASDDRDPELLEAEGVIEIPLDEPSPEPPEHEAAEDVVVERDDEILAALARLEDRLAESQRLIDRQADIAAKLHVENQTLRGGELRTAQAALVTSVIRVHDDVLQMAATVTESERRRDLELVADALTDALARTGVDILTAAEGEPFDAARHRIAEVRETSDPAADRTVVAVVRAGFAWTDGTTVRVSDVVVHKYVPRGDDADDQTD